MELHFTIKKPIGIVFDYLSDMQKFASVHPVISKIEQTAEDHFIVHETLKLGFIPISFTYPVTLESNLNDKTVNIRGTVMKMTMFKLTFVLKAIEEVTAVEEQVSIKSIWLIRLMMKHTIRTQHKKLFKNIENK